MKREHNNNTHLSDLDTGVVRMGWMRRGRGPNASGYDGITEPRDRALSHGSAPSRFSVVLLCMTFFLSSAMASWDYNLDSFKAQLPDNPNGVSPFKYHSDHDSDSCASSDATVVTQQHPLPMRTEAEDDQVRIRDEFKDGSINGMLTFHNSSTGEEWVQEIFFDMTEDWCRCRCKTVTPEDECEEMSIHISYAAMCIGLNLDPDRPITESSTGYSIDRVWYWEIDPDDDSAREDFKDYDSFDHAADRWAYWNVNGAYVKIPIHRLGPHEFHFQGSPLTPWSPSHVDLGLTPPDDVEPTTPPVPNSGHHELGDGELKKSATEDYEQAEGVDECCGSGGENDQSTDDGWEELAFEDDENTYEVAQETDLDNYLRYKIIPLRLNNSAKQRKQWTQNARRRYQLRHINGEDSELR
jgi:hypothetical protein